MSTSKQYQEHKKVTSSFKVLLCRSHDLTQSGITSLAQRLTTKTVPNEPRIAEIGWNFYLSEIETSFSKLEVEYLTTQAGERFTSVAQKTTKDIGLSLIVFCVSTEDLLEHSSTDVLQAIKKQLSEHHDYDKLIDCRFLLAVTKSDLVSDLGEIRKIVDDLMKTNRIRDFSSYVICSARTGYGCEQLEKEIGNKLIHSYQAKLGKSAEEVYTAESKLIINHESKSSAGEFLGKFGVPALHHSTSSLMNITQEKSMCASLDELFPDSSWHYENNKFCGRFASTKAALEASKKIKDANCDIGTNTTASLLQLEHVTHEKINKLTQTITPTQIQGCLTT